MGIVVLLQLLALIILKLQNNKSQRTLRDTIAFVALFATASSQTLRYCIKVTFMQNISSPFITKEMEKKQINDQILNHALVIIHLLTEEDSLLQHITDSLMVKELSNRQISERILNHALGIVYLLSGEEFAIVRKNSPHSSIHHLNGEVPLTCGDVAVYFSLDEWDYIKGHKELYKDVLENYQNSSTVEVIESRLSEVKGSMIGKHDGDNILKEMVESDSSGKIEDLWDDKENYLPITYSEEEDNELVEVETKSNNYTNDVKAGIVSDEKEAKDPSFKKELESPEPQYNENVHTRYCELADGSSKRNVLQEHFTASSLLDDKVLNATSTSFRFQGEDDIQNKESEPALCNIKHITSSNFPHHREKPLSKNEGSDGEWNSVEVKVEMTTDGESSSREQIYTGYQPLSGRENTHKCNVCGKEFGYKCYLTIHLRTHTGEKPHKCNECGKYIASKAKLIIHQRTHTGEKPYNCKECGKQFRSKPYLVEHMRSHTGEKPHRCNECGKQFAYKSRLVVHQRTHTGDKPHRCYQCGKHFDYVCYLIRHLKTHKW